MYFIKSRQKKQRAAGSGDFFKNICTFVKNNLNLVKLKKFIPDIKSFQKKKKKRKKIIGNTGPATSGVRN